MTGVSASGMDGTLLQKDFSTGPAGDRSKAPLPGPGLALEGWMEAGLG